MAYMYLGDGAEFDGSDREGPNRGGAEPAANIFRDTAEEAAGPETLGPETPGGAPFGAVLNWFGALLSLGLVAGLAVWGYELAVRDVTGVPVIEALEAPMRVAPDDPGGLQAAHQGLSVNGIAAEGTAEAPADRLVLAPPPLTLSDEDLPRADLVPPATAPTDAPETASETAAVPEIVATPLDDPAAEALALADQIAEGVTPLSGVVDPPEIAPIPASVGGIVRSARPVPRPKTDLVARAAGPEDLSARPALDVDPASLAPGTRLVQFGAYDSPEAARAEWDRLDARFTDFLTDKQRVIERALSGGKTFFRLRALGFEDINDARRFCTAFLAERQPCIPVVVR